MSTRALGPAIVAAFALPAILGAQGGRGRAPIQLMTLSTTAFADGGSIPAKYAQEGHDVSPALSWSAAPDSVASFVVIVHDVNAPAGNGTDDVLHWMVWNIPRSMHELREGMPQGPELPDGLRQISVSGPYYRGPAAPASGPLHHYVFELYALDIMLDIKPVGAPPPATRAAVLAAMAGHVRGKAAIVGVYKRP